MPENVTYNGTIQMQKPEVTDRAGNVLEEDKDYTLTYSDDVVNSGIVTVTVNGITSASQNGKLVCTYQILPANISDNAVTRPVIMLMVNKEAQQNRTRTVSPAAIPSKANYRVKSKKHL